MLLHDIHPATVTALPVLLKELQERGYQMVQVVADGERPESVPEPVASKDAKELWPRPCRRIRLRIRLIRRRCGIA